MSENDTFTDPDKYMVWLEKEVERLEIIIRNAGQVLDRQGLDHPHIALTILMEEALKE